MKIGDLVRFKKRYGRKIEGDIPYMIIIDFPPRGLNHFKAHCVRTSKIFYILEKDVEVVKN